MEPIYKRKKHVITKIATNEVVFRGMIDLGVDSLMAPSINKAKKESHKLQLSNGGLGLGSLVVCH